MNYYQVIGAMPGPKIEPMLYTNTSDDAWPSDDNTTWTDDSGNPPTKTIGRGFCFDCDHPVEMEYDQWWTGDSNYQPPKTCLECGGHDVEFMGRVAERLWQRLANDFETCLECAGPSESVFGNNIRDAIRIVREYIAFSKRLEQSLEQHTEIFQRLADR